MEVSDWAALIVPIVKPDKSVCLCRDYKLAANPNAKLDNYPIPRNDDVLTSLAGGEKFSKFDLKHAYRLIVVAEKSRKMLTINTHRGLFGDPPVYCLDYIRPGNFLTWKKN